VEFPFPELVDLNVLPVLYHRGNPVGRPEYRRSRVVYLHEEVLNLVGGPIVKAEGGVVREEYYGFLCYGSGYGQLLPLTGGELGWIGVPPVYESNPLKRPFCPFLRHVTVVAEMFKDVVDVVVA